MKKIHLLLMFLLILFAGIPTAFAQQKTVAGKITDASGKPVVAATVTAKGSKLATQTNSEGLFSIDVPNSLKELVISSVGFTTQQININGTSNVSVALSALATDLTEVTVAALGVERKTKNLQFSQTTVGGENMTQAREISAANALAGRVAGVNVTKIASGPAGSSRVVIRGAKTLGANLNQPLYVVDGVPIDNTNFGQAGKWGGSDQGDAMSSLSPDDIASMTVLKGAGAAALYGSRAANGVILITTKKGSARKGIGVEFNSNYVMENVVNLTDYQKTHGTGGYVGNDPLTAEAKTAENLDQLWNNWWALDAWGPKFNGQPTVQFDGKTRPYSYAGDNWKRFYKTGQTLTNSLALSGGSETQNFRLSIADLRNKGVVPNSSFDRVNITLATNSKFGKKLTISSKVMYSNEKVKGRPNVADSPGNEFIGLQYLPGDVNIMDLMGDPNKPGAVPSLEQQQAQGISIFDGKSPGEEMQISKNLWTQNPWWSAYQTRNEDVRDRVITTANVKYDINSFLYVSGQFGMDWYTQRGTQLAGVNGTAPQGTGHQRDGAMQENEYRTREINLQYMLGFNKKYGSFGVNAFFGGNQMRRTNEVLAINGQGFNTPFFAAISNARLRDYSYGYGKQGINSLFASAEVSFNDYLFLTATGRKDWFSVLNLPNNSIVYPSVGASFVFSQALRLPDWFSFGKARIGWAQVGNANSVQPYQTTVTYTAGTTHIGSPLGGFSSGRSYPNTALKPFTSTELEFGLEAKFFNNRLGFDITYYDQTTTDDILDATISQTSGFTSTVVNLGKLTNKGLEFLITGAPIKGALTWDVSLNFAQNTSKVVSLFGNQTEVIGEEPRTRTVFIKHIVGQPYGMITGITQSVDAASGLPVFDASGRPVSDRTYNIIGKGVPDFTGGINNSFTFKGFNLTFLIDFKSGGSIYSGTNLRMTQAGYTKESLIGRAGEAPLTVTGVTDNGSGGYKPFTRTLSPAEAKNYWGAMGDNAAEHFTYDASFIKLRQLTFGYTLPKKIFTNTPIQSLMISIVGRNLAILSKNVPNIDPESSYTSSNGQGLDYFGMPATRSWGFNLRATF